MATSIGALHAQLTAGVASFERDMGRARQAVARNGTAMERNYQRVTAAANQNIAAVTKMSTVTTGLTRLFPALAGAASVAGIVNFTKDTIASTAALGDLADRLELSSVRLQGLGHAADVSGSSAETLEKALEKLQSNIGLAAQGSGSAQKAFDLLGISVRDSGGEVKRTDQIFDEIVAKLERVKTGTELAALAGQLFGERYGRDLVSLLARGTAGIQELENEIIKLDEGSVKAAQRLNDEWTTFTTNFSNGMKQAVLNTLNFIGVIDTAFEAMDLPSKIAETKRRIAELQEELAKTPRQPDPLLLGTDVLINIEQPGKESALAKQQEILAGLEKQAALQERLKGITENLAETDVVSTKQVDQVKAFIETQTREIEHLELTAEAMQRGQAAVDGLNDAIAIQEALIKNGLIPADTSLVEATNLANTSTDERVRRVAALVTQMQQAKVAIDNLALAEQQKAERDAARSAEIEKQIQLIKQLEQTEAEAAEKSIEQQERLQKSLFDTDRMALSAGFAISSGLASGIMEGEKLDDIFRNLIGRLAEMVLQAILFKAIMSSFGAAGIGPFSGLFAKGGVVEAAKGTVVPFAKGGLIKQPTVFPFADGIGLAGEKGTEAIMPLMRDRSGRLGVSAQGTGGNVEVHMPITVINNSDAEVTTERRNNAAGQEELVIRIDRALGAMANHGEGQLFKAFKNNFGLSSNPVSK